MSTKRPLILAPNVPCTVCGNDVETRYAHRYYVGLSATWLHQDCKDLIEQRLMALHPAIVARPGEFMAKLRELAGKDLLIDEKESTPE